MDKKPLPYFMVGLRAVVQAYQAYEKVAHAHFAELGLNSAQFDILATLGNTSGMTCRELGERTFITKGSLTGVLDKMIERGWIVREPHPTDRRVVMIRLTNEGQALFESSFSAHIAYMENVLKHVTPEEFDRIAAACHPMTAVLRNKGS